MSVVFSDNFDDLTLYASNWVGTADIPLSAGGCDLSGGVIACQQEFGFAIQHAITGDASISYRARLSIKWGSAETSGDTEPLAVLAPQAGSGFGFFVSFQPDGKIGLRMNEVTSQITSSAGVWPIDGSEFAVQWRMTITSDHTVDYAFDIDNVTVWSGSYDWTAFSADRTDGLVTAVRVQAQTYATQTVTGVRTLIDTVEIDNSPAKVDWSTCGMIVIDDPCPVPVLTALNMTCGLLTATVSGSNWRKLTAFGVSSDPTLYFVGPDATIYGPGSGYTVDSCNTITGEYAVTFDSPVTAGEWCAFLINQAYCMETTTEVDPSPPLPAFFGSADYQEYSNYICTTITCGAADEDDCPDDQSTAPGLWSLEALELGYQQLPGMFRRMQ